MERFDEAVERLDEFARRQLATDNITGLSIALTDRESLLHVAGWGYANAASRSPLTPEHLFEFGSIGKSFTSIVWQQLRETGHVDLHAPFSDYLPWFSVPSRYSPITAHHLLSHTAGIINGTDFSPDQRFEVWALRDTETGSPPGSYYHYSNIGYKALGLALERLLGASYARIISERILDPLGMQATMPVITHETRKRLAAGHASFYDDRPDHPSRPRVPATWLETDTGDGCICSTPADLATYLRALLNRGSGLISAESFALMTQPVIAAPGWGDDRAYGYGLATCTVDGRLHVTHGGGMVGYHASMLGDMQTGVGAVALINSPGDALQFTRYALGLLRAVREDRTLPPLPEATRPTRVANASDYAGTFDGPGRSLSLRADGERLLLETGAVSVALESRGADAFFVGHPDFERFLLRFGRQEGRVVEAFHGGDWYASSAYAGPRAFDIPPEWRAYPGHYRSHNPWLTSLRVVLRKGRLYLIEPSGDEHALAPLGDGTFRVDDDPRSAERLHFDTIVDGAALRATYSCCEMYRFFTE